MFLNSFAVGTESNESLTDLATELMADVVYPVHAPTLSEFAGDLECFDLLPAPSSAGLYLIWIYKLL